MKKLYFSLAKQTAISTTRQAVAFYKEHGITIQRLLTDRGSTYRSKLFAATCRQLGIQHRLIFMTITSIALTPH